MTRTTSSSSVGGTTEGSRQDQTGRHAIEKMNANGSAVSDFMDRHMAEHQKQRMSDWEYRWWNVKTILRHLIGVHTLIPIENWTYDEGRPRVTKAGMKCWRCEYREP